MHESESQDIGWQWPVRPWRWSLKARLRWARWMCRSAEELAEVTRHIHQSHHVQETDLAGGIKGRDRFDVLSTAAARTATMPGPVLEFGVFKGVTLRHLAKAIGPARRIVGFDTFEGLPDDWGHLLEKGTFATEAPMLKDYPNAALEVGRIETTLPSFLAAHPGPVSMVHIDVPYHAINVVILEHLITRLPAGAIVVFDEYYGYPSYEDHEFRAWAEIRSRFSLITKPLAYSSRSAAFLIVQNPGCSA